jgi:hypothetical protein
MIKEITTRTIDPKVTNTLWAKSAGRCEFAGCNVLLYKSSVTQEAMNKAQRAHIYSFSKKGPRGQGEFAENTGEINSEGNLMLMCHQCHHLIDSDTDGSKYSASMLQKWKTEHESKVLITTGIKNDKKSHVIIYGINISSQKSSINQTKAMDALFPDYYPSSDSPILLSTKHSLEDDDEIFWNFEPSQLESAFTRKIQPLIEYDKTTHFSIFALAPMPLLIKLGTLFTDKSDVNTFQPIREPQGWKWQEYPDGFEFITKKPPEVKSIPALVFSISAKIEHERINKALGNDVSIWEITVPEIFCHNDCIKNKAQLSQFRTTVRKVINEINATFGIETPLNIFPAMAVSCSVEFGRVRMPKADMPWVIYDQNQKRDGFIKSLNI